MKKVVDEAPANQGKPLSDMDKSNIYIDYVKLVDQGLLKKHVIKLLCDKYGRGKFSIINIIQEYLAISDALPVSTSAPEEPLESSISGCRP